MFFLGINKDMPNECLYRNLRDKIHCKGLKVLPFYRLPIIPPPPPPPIPQPLVPPDNNNCITNISKGINPVVLTYRTSMLEDPNFVLNNAKSKVLNIRNITPVDVKPVAASVITRRTQTATLLAALPYIPQPPECGPPPYRISNEPTARIKRTCNIPKVFNTG
jgi:hypothetical protein